MPESLVTFGPDPGLTGIVGEPEPDATEPTAPTVVILNAGLLHKTGMCRMSVKLSRRLNAAGVRTLRFDLSGIGDSPPSTDGRTAEERIVAEVRAAMDALQGRFGCEAFALYGLCSGGQNAFKTALVDARVVGLAGVDTFGFRTWRYAVERVRRALPRLGSWVSLGRMIATSVRRRLGLAGNAGEPAYSEPDWGEYPPLDEVQAGYQALVDRGVRLLYFYTGGWEHEYLYAEQFFDMYPKVDFRGQAAVHLVRDMSHVAAEPASQELIVERVTDWVLAGVHTGGCRNARAPEWRGTAPTPDEACRTDPSAPPATPGPSSPPSR